MRAELYDMWANMYEGVYGQRSWVDSKTWVHEQICIKSRSWVDSKTVLKHDPPNNPNIAQTTVWKLPKHDPNVTQNNLQTYPIMIQTRRDTKTFPTPFENQANNKH